MPISFSSHPSDLSSLSAEELRELLLQQQTLLAQTQAVVSHKEALLAETQAVISQKETQLLEAQAAVSQKETQLLEAQAVVSQKEKSYELLSIAHEKVKMELAVLKRINFAKRSEQLPDLQAKLFEEDVQSDLIEVEVKLEELAVQLAHVVGETHEKRAPVRLRLPSTLPSVDIHHSLATTSCTCGCQMRHIGDDISQKLDYVPGVLTVENHVRPKYVCDTCKTLNQAPVPAHVIDKGLPTAGLLASVLIMKYADHLPLYRQETIFERSGLRIPRSTLAGWVGRCGAQLQPLVDALREEILSHSVLQADETPINYNSLQKNKVQKGYFWVYAPSQFAELKAIIYDFKPGRSGAYAREFLGDWQGSLMCDDYAGYKALFANGQVIEGGCWAHARRKFHAIYEANQSEVAAQALTQIQRLYHHESEARNLSPPERLTHRQRHLRPLLEQLETWLQSQYELVPPNSAIAKAIRYSLSNWTALTRLLDDGMMPIDNNAVENLIRPLAIGRKNWLFVGSEIAGRRAAAVMSLIHSARLNGHDPHAYLKDVLERLPTHKAKDIEDLLPHRWQAMTAKEVTQ